MVSSFPILNGFAHASTPSSGCGAPQLRVAGRDMGLPVLCAPLSGITDVPFRRLVRRLGGGLVFSEMVASGELVRNTRESLLRVMADGEGLRAVQLAGRDPAMMQMAARRLADEGVDLIDINFGCPAKKVVGGLCGSALMREPDLAAELVEATLQGAGTVPVSVKMRLGWDADCLNAPEIAARAQSLGVAMVTVHGRTRAQFYSGRADWAAVRRVRQALSIPLVVNGDIASPADIVAARAASGADAVMVGRALQGRPWLLAVLSGTLHADLLTQTDFADLVCRHYDEMIAHYGARVGVRHARKHLGWYLDTFEALAGQMVPNVRAGLMRAEQPAQVTAVLADLFAGTSLADLEYALNQHQRKAA